MSVCLWKEFFPGIVEIHLINLVVIDDAVDESGYLIDKRSQQKGKKDGEASEHWSNRSSVYIQKQLKSAKFF